MVSISQWFARLRRTIPGQHGNTMVIMALSLTAIMGMMAIVIDGGYAYGEKRQMQNAADAGALAGLRVYWMQSMADEQARRDAAEAEACRYARMNGAGQCTATFAVSPDQNVPGNSPSKYILQVQAAKTFNTFFAGMIGRDKLSVSAMAKARVQGVQSSAGLWPIAVPENVLSKVTPCTAEVVASGSCPEVTVYTSDKEDKPSGNAGWLNWNREGHVGDDFMCPKTGTPNLICELRNPVSSGSWDVGEWIPGDPGLKNASEVRDAIESFVGGQHVTVPVFGDYREQGNNGEYQIVGFAEFVLTDINMTGNPKTVTGTFLSWLDSGQSSHQACVSDQYVCTVRLVQD